MKGKFFIIGAWGLIAVALIAVVQWGGLGARLPKNIGMIFVMVSGVLGAALGAFRKQ